MEFLADKKAALFLSRIFSSIYFPFISAAVVLINYYLGWDVVSIWYFSLCGVGIMLTCRDLSPLFGIFMLMGLFTSAAHTPALNFTFGDKGYYTRPYILAQMIVAIAALIGMAVTRVVESIVLKRFKITPIFYGLAVFVAALMFNGIFSEYYTIMNVVYALFLAVVFLGIFCLACGNIQVNEKTYERIAFSALALLSVLSIELLITYITGDVIVNGEIERGNISFGWGTYNNFGLYVMVCLPAPFYLAAKYKHGWAFTLLGLFTLGVAYLCMSRQVILMGTLIFIACAVWLILSTKGVARINNIVIFAIAAIVGILVFALMFDKISKLFSSLLDSLETGSSRTIIWKEATDKFLNYPLFGAGFYSRTRWVWGQSGFANILPTMYHNTVVQLLECSGVVGFGAYVFHRVQTVLSVIRDLSHDRIFIALIIAGILLVSLLDNHIFYLYPTIIYSMLLGVLSLSERKFEVKSACKTESNGAADTAA